jgi:hypothetical protein
MRRSLLGLPLVNYFIRTLLWKWPVGANMWLPHSGLEEGCELVWSGFLVHLGAL